jgi:putative protease
LPELLAPAGNWDCAKAAVENGADAIYFGLERFNARMRADNFTEADLPALMAWLHQRGVKGYVTLNTLIFPEELAAVEDYLKTMIAAGVDAVIVQDVGLCRLIRHLSPDFPIHASTQMTVTSGVGVAFAQALGCNLVVLARECAIKDINKIQQYLGKHSLGLPLEVFVHGALCVAYSGQCLTSEALGGRSANRGECAQACRMPYELIVDGEERDLGSRQYLLSPQDLAGLAVLPELVKTGVTSLKIEGRLKAPEYVAGVTQVYRQALDRLADDTSHPVTAQDQYQLEMSFSRGLYTGWFEGINNQALVHGEFAKKRGVYLGEVLQVLDGRDKQVVLQTTIPIKPGDGVVIASQPEVGGRVYAINRQGNQTLLMFGRRDVDLRRVLVGDRLWKTSDPALEQKLQQTFQQKQPQFQRPLVLTVTGEAEGVLTVFARTQTGQVVQVNSQMPLIVAEQQHLTSERLEAQLGRLGNTPFCLGTLENQLVGEVILPISELNRIRREMVSQLEELLAQPKVWQLNSQASYADLLPTPTGGRSSKSSAEFASAELIPLVRSLPQLEAVLELGMPTIYCELEDPRAYRQAVQQVWQANYPAQIWLAPPRITKPGENYILEQVRQAGGDGILVRNYDQLAFFVDVPQIGDFSLNVANPITASYYKTKFGLQRLTASYDLNATQLTALLSQSPADWWEVTIHQHMPMFHMEHCVFCAFLSNGTDFTNCGRPCDHHQVKLRDRAGIEHVLQADAGCRNTVFNGTAQTGAEYVHHLLELGLKHLRLEFVDESPSQVVKTMRCYQDLLAGKITGNQLWRQLQVHSQLGVTRGALEAR